MLFEYSYDKMNHVLSLFEKGEIASLDIEKVSKNDEEVFAIDFKELTELSKAEELTARKVLTNSLPERLNAMHVLNTFLENQSRNSTKEFKFHFNVANTNKCELIYSYAFGASDEIALPKQLEMCLENLETLTTKLGVKDVSVPNLYRRDRGKKYSNVNISEILHALRLGLLQE